MKKINRGGLFTSLLCSITQRSLRQSSVPMVTQCSSNQALRSEKPCAKTACRQTQRERERERDGQIADITPYSLSIWQACPCGTVMKNIYKEKPDESMGFNPNIPIEECVNDECWM